MSFAASLFLDGRPLLRRGLAVTGRSPGDIVFDYALPHSETKDAALTAPWCGFADGALFHQPLARLGSPVGGHRVWCGDLDSCAKNERQDVAESGGEQLTERIVLQPDKDLSDGAALFERCYAHLCAIASQASTDPETKAMLPLALEVIGAFGGRRDHEEVNLAELEHVFFGPSHGVATGWALVVQPSIVLSNVGLVIRGLPPGMPVTLVSAQPDLRLQLEGLRYSGEVQLKRPSQGLSNEVCGASVSVRPFAQNLRNGSQASQASQVAYFRLILGHNESAFLG